MINWLKLLDLFHKLWDELQVAQDLKLDTDELKQKIEQLFSILDAYHTTDDLIDRLDITGMKV